MKQPIQLMLMITIPMRMVLRTMIITIHYNLIIYLFNNTCVYSPLFAFATNETQLSKSSQSQDKGILVQYMAISICSSNAKINSNQLLIYDSNVSPNLSFKMSTSLSLCNHSTLYLLWQRLLSSSPDELAQSLLQSSAIVFVSQSINIIGEKIKGRSVQYNPSNSGDNTPPVAMRDSSPFCNHSVFVCRLIVEIYICHFIQIKKFVNTISTNAPLSAAAVSQALILVRGCPTQSTSTAG
jgi:hypothetical protein